MGLYDTLSFDKSQYRLHLHQDPDQTLHTKWHDKVSRLISKWIKIGAYGISARFLAGVPLIGVPFNLRQIYILYHKVEAIDSEIRQRKMSAPVVTRDDVGRGAALGVAGALIGLGLMEVVNAMTGDDIQDVGKEFQDALTEAGLHLPSNVGDFASGFATGTQATVVAEMTSDHGASQFELKSTPNDPRGVNAARVLGQATGIEMMKEVQGEAAGELVEKKVEERYDEWRVR